MNTLSGLTFYDSLSKLTIGFLLTWFWIPGLINAECTSCSCYNCVICEFCGCSCCVPELNAIQTGFYLIICFIAGCLWQALMFLLPDGNKNSNHFDCICDLIPYGKSNYEEWIWQKRNDVYVDNKFSLEKRMYYAAYYRVSKSGMMNRISVIESLEAFLRINSVIYVSYLSYFMFIIWKETSSDLSSDLCCFMTFAFLVLFFVLIYFYFSLWKYYNTKVYELVWEADKYLSNMKDSEK